MIVEEFVPGRELTQAVMDGRALGVTEITTSLEFYDYEAKYAAGGSRHILPAEDSAGTRRKGDAPCRDMPMRLADVAGFHAQISGSTTPRARTG